MPLPSRFPKAPPQHVRRERDGMDRNHVKNVGDLCCCICGDPRSVHAHHLLKTGERGMGLKSPDRYCVPLCVQHHQDLHDAGDEEGFLASHYIDGRSLAQDLWRNKGDMETMLRSVLRALQAARLKDTRPHSNGSEAP